MGMASAAPLQLQDGLVNVNVEDVNVLAEQLDTDGGSQPVTDCTAFTQPVSLQQNGPGQGNAATAPGQNRG